MVKPPHALARFVTRSSQKICVITCFSMSCRFLSLPSPVTAAERAVRRRVRASSVRGGGREQDGVTGGGHGTLRGRWVSILNRGQRLQQIGDVAVTLSGVCLCAFWTTLLYHLLWGPHPPPPLQWPSSHTRSSTRPLMSRLEALGALMCLRVCSFVRLEIIFLHFILLWWETRFRGKKKRTKVTRCSCWVSESTGSREYGAKGMTVTLGWTRICSNRSTIKTCSLAYQWHIDNRCLTWGWTWDSGM